MRCNLRYFIILFLAQMCFLGSVPAQNLVSNNDQKRLADGLYSRGLYDLALIEYQKLLGKTPPPDNLDTLFFRAGESAARSDQPKLSSTYFNKAVDVGGNSAAAQRAKYRLADLAFVKGENDVAEKLLRELLSGEIDESIVAPVKFTLAQILEKSALSESLSFYKELLDNYPDDPLSAYATLRIADLSQGGAEAKRKAYERALRNPPSRDFEIETLWGLASLEVSSKNFQKAAEIYWRLWKSYPDSARVSGGRIHIAWAQLQAGEYKKAITLYENTPAAEKKSDGDTWSYLAGMSYLKTDQVDEALESFQTLLETYPESRFRPYAVYEISVAYAAEGAHEKVVAYAKDLQRIPGREVEGLWMLAESFRASGDFRNAIQLYTRISHQHPDHPRAADALYFRALLLVKRGDTAISTEALVEFSRRFPKDPRAYSALEQAGDLWVRKGKLQEGLDVWLLLLEQHSSADLLLKIALLEIRLEKTSSAQNHLESFLEEDPEGVKRATAQYWLGVLHDQEGEHLLAQSYLTSALEGELKKEWVTAARLRLGQSYYRNEQSAEALDAFLPLFDHPRKKELSDSLILWLLSVAEEKEKHDAIVKIASEMIQEYRKPVIQELGYYGLAKEFGKQEQTNEAIEAWKSGLAFDSESLDSVQGGLQLASLYLETKEFENAYIEFMRATRLASALEEGALQAQGMMGSGRVRYLQSKWEEAARHFMSVAILYDDPKLTPRALQQAADSFRKAGQPAKARAAAEELDARYPDFSSTNTP